MVVTPGATLTYGELRDRAEALRAHFAAQGIGPGDRVGVALEPSPDFPATVLALLALDAVYVPVDAMNPPGRIASILDGAAPKLVVCDASTAGVAPALEHPLPVRLPAADPAPVEAPGGSAVAYLMHTSGSTGTPKGVLVTHDNILAFVRNVRTLFELTPEDRFLGYASCGFDVSVFEMFGALLTGASLHLVAGHDAARHDGRPAVPGGAPDHGDRPAAVGDEAARPGAAGRAADRLRRRRGVLARAGPGLGQGPHGSSTATASPSAPSPASSRS